MEECPCIVPAKLTKAQALNVLHKQGPPPDSPLLPPLFAVPHGNNDREGSRRKHEVLRKPIRLVRSVSDTSSKTFSAATAALPCSVCLETGQVRTRNLCPSLCAAGNICLKCSNKYWTQYMKDFRYVLAPPKCLGCKVPLQTLEYWRRTIGPQLFAQFTTNLENLFILRCPRCDEDKGFWPRQGTRSLQTRAACWNALEIDNYPKLAFALEAFEQHKELSAKQIVDEALEAFGKKRARQLLCPHYFIKENGDDEPKGNEMEPVMLLDLFAHNIERMATLLHEWLRRPEAMVSTSCCRYRMCFSCKYNSWHLGQTCQEVIRLTMEEAPEKGKLFQCPKCFVSCVHAGGCARIRCICGHQYHLNPI